MTRTPRASRSLRLTAIVTALVVSTAGLTSLASAAYAAYGDPVIAVFEAQKEKIYYGDDWYLEVQLRNHGCQRNDCDGEALFVTLTGANGISRKGSMYVSPQGIANPSNYEFGSNLPAGTYSLVADYNDKHCCGPDPGMHRNNKPGTLVITPAPLSIDLRVETDPNQPAGAVVSSQLLGDFVDNANNCYEGSACERVLADGTWDFSITSEGGEPLVEKQITTKGDASRFASFYWHDVPSSADYEATATFTPVKSGAGNFTIDSPGTASFTSPDAVAVGGPGAPEEPVVEVVVNEDSTVPLWGVIAWFIVLGLLLAVAVVFTLLVVRQRRALGTPATTESELS